MTVAYLQQHWALLGAGLLGVAVLLFAAWRAWLDSSRGRLRAARRRLLARQRAAARCLRAGERARSRLERLARRSESVKPNRLQAAEEAVQDADALAKIAGDQVLIAASQLRRIIVEEFPPKRHARLRRRYLPGEGEDGKPFTL